MSAVFVAASTQVLTNSAAPFTGPPFTVGMWIYPTSLAAQQTLFCLGDTGATNQHLRFVLTTNPFFSVRATSGASSQFTNFGVPVVNTWQFIVARFISSSNRRGAAIQRDGSTVHAQGTTNIAPTSLDTMSIGARVTSTTDEYASCRIGEFWYTNTDIQADGAQLQDSTLRQLAYSGPFSLPHIAKDIIEYRSFRSRLDSRADIPDEVYHKGLRQTWTNTNGVTLGPHPPAAVGYDSPLFDVAPMVIV